MKYYLELSYVSEDEVMHKNYTKTDGVMLKTSSCADYKKVRIPMKTEDAAHANVEYKKMHRFFKTFEVYGSAEVLCHALIRGLEAVKSSIKNKED